MGIINENNPWVSQLALPENETTEAKLDGGFRKLMKYWDEVNRRKEDNELAEQIAEENLKKLKNEETANFNEIDEEKRQLKTEKGDAKTCNKKGKIKKKQEEEKITKTKEKSKAKKKKVNSLKKNNDGKVKKSNTNDNVPPKECLEKITCANESMEEDLDIDSLFEDVEKKLMSKAEKKWKKIEKDRIQNIKEGVNLQKEMKELHKKKIELKKKGKDRFEFDFSVQNEEEMLEEGLERLKTLEDLEKFQEQAKLTDKEGFDLATKSTNSNNALTNKEEIAKVESLDLTNFDITKIKSRKLLSRGASRKQFGDFGDASSSDESEKDEDFQDILDDIYQDEDLIKEFEEEKLEKEKKDEGESTDRLKGWGTWLGPDGEEEIPKKRNKKNLPDM